MCSKNKIYSIRIQAVTTSEERQKLLRIQMSLGSRIAFKVLGDGGVEIGCRWGGCPVILESFQGSGHHDERVSDVRRPLSVIHWMLKPVGMVPGRYTRTGTVLKENSDCTVNQKNIFAYYDRLRPRG